MIVSPEKNSGVEIPATKGDSTSRWAFKKQLGPKGGTCKNDISALTEETAESPPVLPHVRLQEVASGEEGPDLTTPSQTSSFQNDEKYIYFVYK